MKRRLFVALLIILGLGYIGFRYFASKSGQTEQSLPEVLGISSALPESITSLFTKATDSIETTDADTKTTEITAQLGSAATQLRETSERSLEVAKHAGNVLGTAVTATNSTPLHERAIEYAQYTYCKQVVLEHEKLNGAAE